MTWEIHDKEIENVLHLQPAERYSHFVTKIADWREVWSLKSDDGWCMMGDEKERICLPFWPHPKYAQLCAVGRWKNTAPEIIPLDNFVTKWLLGMAKDNRLVAVFPTPEQKGIIVTPEHLATDIEKELKKIQ